MSECNSDKCAFASFGQSRGLTKREYIACSAMQGLLSCQDFVNELIRREQCDSMHDARSRIALFAVRQADALLAELAKKQGD